MTLLELFKKLVSISRPEPAPLQPDEVLTGIIRDALTLNLEYVTGSAIDITVKGSEPGLFEKVLSASGYMVSTFCGDEVPCSQFILPAETARNLLAKMKSVHSDITVEEEGALTLLMDQAEGNLYHMFLPRQGEAGGHIRMKHEYRAADLQAVLWNASDSVIFQARAGDYTAFITVPQGVWSGLLSGAGDKDFVWRLRSIAVTEYTGEGGSEPGKETASIDIKRPGEFLLGRFFLPVFLKVDDTVVSSSFKKVSSGIDFPVSGCFRVSLDIKVDEEIHRIWYCFEGYSLNTFNEGFGAFDGLFKSMLRDTVSSIKSCCPELKIAGIRYNATPPSESVDNSVILHSELRINFRSVSALVAVPSSFINLIAFNILSPWELNLLQSTPRNRILGALSVNSALFSRGIGSFLDSFRGVGENISAVLTCMPFYEFMELVSDADLKIIAQNFILPAFSSAYMQLFRIGVTDFSGQGNAGCRLYTVNSNWQRIKRYLPRNVLEDAEAGMHWTGADSFDALNKMTMTDLYAASESGRLLLSARARFILRNQFFDAVQAGYRAELESLRAAGEPFTSLGGLPYNTRQLAVTRVSDRDLCLLMLWAGEEKMQALTPLMSRARRRKIMEDVEVLGKQYRDAMITPGDIVRAVGVVRDSLEREKKRK